MEEQRARILLIEDDPDDVWVMRNLLGDRWDGPFELVHVELLSAGLERCASGRYDLVLLDLCLPDSRGLETFLLMYAQAGGVPIVVLTDYNDETIAIKAVQAGAQDYLVKGQVNDQLLVRSIRYAIERTRRRHAEEALRATSEEFRAARDIQQRLFPEKAPQLPGFDLAGALHPAKATAGDYFDFIPMRDESLGIVVGDVSSHGMGSALLMAETRACLRTLAQVHSDVGQILTHANRVLTADTHELQFVTLVLMLLEPGSRSLVYASAGQRGYLLDPGGAVTVLDSTSIPLGVDRETIVPCAPRIHLQPGQLVTFFTDGVFEAESGIRGRFGVERALMAIQSERNKPANEIIDSLFGKIALFCRHQPQRDDITAVIIKVQSPA